MDTEKSKERIPCQNKYPYNLLVAIRGVADKEIPEDMTDDHLAGLEYVLSTLECRERDILFNDIVMASCVQRLLRVTASYRNE